MPNPSANPTPITPPRVPLIDARTGLIDRAWYMFFLSLNNVASSVVDNSFAGSSTDSLLASYDAALMSLAQNVDTQPILPDTSAETTKQIQAVGLGESDLVSQVAELQKQVNGIYLTPPPSTMLTDASGILPIANGGTNGTAVPTAGAAAYGTGTAYGFTAAGTAGQILSSNGAGVPTWATVGTLPGVVTLVTTATYTVVLNDFLVKVTLAGNTTTLLSAVTASGHIYYINNASTGSITVDTTGGQLINGLLAQSLPADSTMQVYSDGTGWHIL